MKHRRRRRIATALSVAALAAAAAGGLAVAAPSTHHCRAVAGMQDRKCTPGVLNAAVRQSNIQQTICVTHFTDGIRPKPSYTDQLKLEQMRWYGLSGPPGAYEEDHLISLELGGNPTDPANLWPQAYAPVPGARQKDGAERHLHSAVCHGQMTLAAAQAAIVNDWISIWRQITP